MARLTSDQRAFIVTRLACYRTPTEVAKDFADAFGTELDRQQVQHYDPTTVQGVRLAKKWRTLFEKTREAYIRDAAGSAISIQRFRLDQLLQDLQTLQEEIDNQKLRKIRNPALIAQMVAQRKGLLETAAKEMGGLFENRRKIEFEGDGAAAFLAHVLGISPDELKDAE